MATSVITKTQCFTCNKQIRTFICRGCSKDFCSKCLSQHLESLSQGLDEIETDHDQFRQFFNEEQQNPSNRSVLDEINKWEEYSINKIKQRANECRERLLKHTKNSFLEIEDRLTNLGKELKENRQENEFNEIDLDQFKRKLNKLKVKLNNLSNISMVEGSSCFIENISIIDDTTWKEDGITVVGGNGQGNGLNQLHSPVGISIDNDQTIYVADYTNHRIVAWKPNAINGQLVAGGNGAGNNSNQLNNPLDVIIDKETNSLIISDQRNRRVMRWSLQNNTNNGEILISDIDCYGLAMNKAGDLYVSDYERDEVKRWKRGETNGTIVAGGNGQGDQLNQLNYPTFIFVDENDSLYVSDRDNHRIIKWIKDAKEGIVVAGGTGQGNSLTQLSSPRGVAVDCLGQIYVVDCGNHRIMRWCEGTKERTIVIGGNEQGQQSNQLNSPRGLSFDREGNLYVADYGNHRMQTYEID